MTATQDAGTDETGIEPVRAVALGSNTYEFHQLDEMGPLLDEFLRARADVAVDLRTDRDVLREESLSAHDVLIDYTTSSELTDEQWSGLHGFVYGGGGYVGLHGASAVYFDTESPRLNLETLIGGAFEGHDEFDRLPVEIVDRDHPITRDLADYSILDEPYECRIDRTVRVLARAHHDSVGDLPIAWTKRYGEGRVFYCANGHDERAFAHPSFQELVTRGIEWTAGRL